MKVYPLGINVWGGQVVGYLKSCKFNMMPGAITEILGGVHPNIALFLDHSQILSHGQRKRKIMHLSLLGSTTH